MKKIELKNLRQEKSLLGYKIVRGDITQKERERIAEINRILEANEKPTPKKG